MSYRSTVGVVAAALLVSSAGWWLWTGGRVTPPGDSRTARIEEYIKSENAKTLDFYGKVMDQHGDPVAGAKVKARVGLIVSIVESGGRQYFTETDVTGCFSFVGIHGSGVGFDLAKDGYEFNQRQAGSERPDGYLPDPKNPVVLKMWKLRGAEPMIKYDISNVIPCDGTPIHYDLLNGHRVPNGGDLIVKLVRLPININRGKPFDWSVTLEIRGGGLAEINDLYPNEAPTEGYQPLLTIDMPTTAKNWRPSVTRSFYFKSDFGGNYGRITVRVQADFQPPPTYFGADVYVNPAGSRNLEFDPYKQIE